jgi:ribosomal protein S19E (S16A)
MSEGRSRKAEPFVKVPLWWITAAAKATRTPGAVVLIYLLHAQWKAKRATFGLPNGALKKAGASREMKRRVLRQLEAAGLITVERRHGKTPKVTVVVL